MKTLICVTKIFKHTKRIITMDMSLIAGMPEVIAYIRSQDERIKGLEDENKKLKELELTEENAIQYVYDNSSQYEDWVMGSTVYQELKAELDCVKKENEDLNRRFNDVNYVPFNSNYTDKAIDEFLDSIPKRFLSNQT